jgi:hypothetical protein
MWRLRRGFRQTETNQWLTHTQMSQVCILRRHFWRQWAAKSPWDLFQTVSAQKVNDRAGVDYDATRTSDGWSVGGNGSNRRKGKKERAEGKCSSRSSSSLYQPQTHDTDKNAATRFDPLSTRHTTHQRGGLANWNPIARFLEEWQTKQFDWHARSIRSKVLNVITERHKHTLI